MHFLPDRLFSDTVQARILKGGGGWHTPTHFVPNFLKSPLTWPKYALKTRPRTTCAPSFFNPVSAPAVGVTGNNFSSVEEQFGLLYIIQFNCTDYSKLLHYTMSIHVLYSRPRPTLSLFHQILRVGLAFFQFTRSLLEIFAQILFSSSPNIAENLVKFCCVFWRTIWHVI